MTVPVKLLTVRTPAATTPVNDVRPSSITRPLTRAPVLKLTVYELTATPVVVELAETSVIGVLATTLAAAAIAATPFV
jgi:hypothetical protein